MTTPVVVDDHLIAEWRNTGHPYKVVAAAMAEWALKQDLGTELPGNDFFAGDLPIVAGRSTWQRAKAFLKAAGVLYMNDGPYRVAYIPPEPASPAGPGNQAPARPSSVR
jgi:hypothetical protein